MTERLADRSDPVIELERAAWSRSRSRTEAAKQRLHEYIAEQRCAGHGDGQEHTIADVNAGRVDDLIRQRLNTDRDVRFAAYIREWLASRRQARHPIASDADLLALADMLEGKRT